MEDLPQIAAVDSPTKFFNVVYEENETSRKNKVLAYLNQIGFINAPLNVTFTVGPASTPSIQVDFTTEYKLILEEFIKSADQQFACPSTLTREQRAIVHKLATELGLNHETKGNWRRMILYIYKGQLNMHIQRNSQAISSALNNIATTSQQINQNVLDVIAAGPSVSEPLDPSKTAKKKRGRPPKSAQTQPTSSTGVVAASSTNLASTQAPRRYPLRNRKTD